MGEDQGFPLREFTDDGGHVDTAYQKTAKQKNATLELMRITFPSYPDSQM